MPSSGKTSASAAIAAAGLHRVALLGRLAAPAAAPAPRARTGSTAATSASSVSLTSATIASPIGARAASSGSLVIAHQRRALGQQRPGDVRVVGEHRRRRRRGQVVAGERLATSGPIAGGSTPRKCGWSSGKPIRPPPVAGAAHTGSRAFSASATAASQPPLASMSGPATKTGFCGRRRAARASSRTSAGSAPARAVDRARRLVARRRRRRPPRASRPSGSRRTPGPSAAATRGGSRARARAGRPRRAAARSST